MSLHRNFLASFLAALVTSGLMITPAKAGPIEWAPVANPGNAADTTGYGDVEYTFKIMKYEFTNTRYAEFLNAIDPQSTNPQGVWAAMTATKSGQP